VVSISRSVQRFSKLSFREIQSVCANPAHIRVGLLSEACSVVAASGERIKLSTISVVCFVTMCPVWTAASRVG
jgi:hypothetical protein